MADQVAYPISPKSGGLIAASVTASTAATANTLFTLTRNTEELIIAADLNNSCMVTYNGLDMQYLPAGANVVRNWSRSYAVAGAVIGVYYIGGAPTAGRIYAQVT